MLRFKKKKVALARRYEKYVNHLPGTLQAITAAMIHISIAQVATIVNCTLVSMSLGCRTDYIPERSLGCRIYDNVQHL
jgi:hypothetical protein